MRLFAGWASGCCLVALLLVAGLGPGCRRSEEPPQPAGTERAEEDVHRPLTFKTGLTPESTPQDVAELFLEGLRTDNGEFIAALVPARAEAEALEQMFRAKGVERRVTPESAARAAAAGLRLSCILLDPNSARVVGGSTDGGRAVVQALGSHFDTGKPMTLELQMIREDGIWRVQKALAAPG